MLAMFVCAVRRAPLRVSARTPANGSVRYFWPYYLLRIYSGHVTQSPPSNVLYEPASRVTRGEGGRHRRMYRFAGSRDTHVWVPASISLSCLQPAIRISSPPTLLALPPLTVVKLHFIQFRSPKALSATMVVCGSCHVPLYLMAERWTPFPRRKWFELNISMTNQICILVSYQ